MPARDTTDAMAAFVDEYGLEFDQAVDEGREIWGRFGVSYQPAWAFVNDDGTLRLHPGALEVDELRAQLEELIAA